MHQNHCIAEAISKVEQTPLNQLLSSGKCNKFQWSTFLHNQRACHIALESRKIITQQELMRTGRLSQDLSKMGFNCQCPNLPLAEITQSYVTYVSEIEVPKLWAHIYVRYLIDIGTSSPIKVSINHPSINLNFDNTDECLSYIREHMIDIDENEMDSALQWILQGYNQIFEIVSKNSINRLTA